MEINVARQRDHLLALDGKQIFPGFFTRLLDGKLWIKNFQFHQIKHDALDLRMEVNDALENENIERIEKLKLEILPKIKKIMGESINLNIYTVASIQRTSAGKHRFVINELKE